jgi:hypothetical protein
MILLETPLDSFLHLSFSDPDIGPIFAVAITMVPKKKKGERESPTSSRSKRSGKVYCTARSDFDPYFVGE